MKMLLPLLALPLLGGCSAYAGTPAAPAQTSAKQQNGQCFFAANVSGFRQGPNDTIIVNINSRDYYELKTLGYCASRLDFENRIALRARTGGFICTGTDAEITIPDAVGPTYCPVRANRKLTPDEVTALRATKK